MIRRLFLACSIKLRHGGAWTPCWRAAHQILRLRAQGLRVTVHPTAKGRGDYVTELTKES